MQTLTAASASSWTDPACEVGERAAVDDGLVFSTGD